MFNSEKEFLHLYGWNDFFQNQLSQTEAFLLPARVICEERNLYRVQINLQQSLWATVRGKMQFDAAGRSDYPAVGDWVMVELPPQSDRAVIHQVLARKSVIQRKQIGIGSDVQILSSNIDYAFISSSVNADLNFRRIERYLAVIWDSGCVPVILLTKADLAEDIASILAATELEFPGVAVHAISQNDFSKDDVFSRYLKNGATAVVVGSSGVGKSTLVNFLINEEKIKTQGSREHDDKGRHTTTSRNLYVSRYGGLIIDTPGMRELQLSDHAEGVSQQFSDIEELMQNCRFNDCQHQGDRGCAVGAALEHGKLARERWQSYVKLQAEVRFAIRKQDKAAAAAEKKLWKQRSVMARERVKQKRGEHDW